MYVCYHYYCYFLPFMKRFGYQREKAPKERKISERTNYCFCSAAGAGAAAAAGAGAEGVAAAAAAVAFAFAFC